MNIWSFVISFLLVYILMSLFMASKQNGGNKRLMSMLDVFKEEEEFFNTANEVIASEKSPVLLEKEKVIKLWGEAYHNRDEDFSKSLEEVNLDTLVGDTRMKKSYEANEDAFFYLYLVIPNNLYSKGKLETIKAVDEKLKAVEEPLGKSLIQAIAKENRKYYFEEGDRGKEFYERVMDGDYGEYEYSKQLIGLYKGMVSAMLLSLYEKEDKKDKYEDLIPAVEAFSQTALGKRWLGEINLTLPNETQE